MSAEDERPRAPSDRLGSASGAIPGDGSGHVSGEQVADLLVDLLPGAEAATVSAHLDACSTCATLRDDLAAVPALLAAVPPPPMPVDVAQRLDAVLAQAAAERSEQDGQSANANANANAQPPAAVIPLATSAARRRRFTGSFAGALTGIAAAAAVVVGVLVVGEVTTQGDSSEDSAASGGSVAADEEAASGGRSARPGEVAIDSQSFRAGVRRTFADREERSEAGPGSGAEAGPTGSDLRPSDSAQDRTTGACPPADLAAAGIPGRYGPTALLDGRPVTLVASGPERDRLVVAYSCATGSPVPQVRTHVDLTR